MKKTKEWYTSWFNTPFYHILYKDRDHYEAKLFMHNLVEYLDLNKGDHILDLACGKGRHSVFLNMIGFEVTGLDLSEESIAHAKQFENETLHFEVHDMCCPYHQRFDAVFNLFTSFGYFENEADNLETIKSIKANLKLGGIAVIDFMNANKVINNLVKSDHKVVDGLRFDLERKYEDGFIIKNINFEAEGEKFEFQERVKAFTLGDFEEMFKQAGIELIATFGDYQLSEYDKTNSERLILVFK